MDLEAMGSCVRDYEKKRVAAAFELAIEASLTTNPLRALTRSAVKDRFNACCRIFKVLRVDLNWNIVKTLDHIAPYLRCELEGVAWKPNERTFWLPGDAAAPSVLVLGRRLLKGLSPDVNASSLR